MDSIQAGNFLSGCGYLIGSILLFIGSILGIILVVLAIIILKLMDLLSGDPL